MSLLDQLYLTPILLGISAVLCSATLWGLYALARLGRCLDQST